MAYQPIRLEDFQTIRGYLQRANKACCDYALANLFAWSGFYETLWRESEGFLIFKFRIAGSEKWAYLEPLGEGSPEKILHEIAAEAAANHEPLRFFSLSAEFVEKISQFEIFKKLRFYKDRNFGNYLYSRKDFAELAGKKFHSKRNFIAQFDRLYPNADAHKITPEDFPKIRQLLDLWTASQPATTTVKQERRMIETALKNYAVLELFGVILTVDGNPAAFAFGSKINHNTFCIHVEKADTNFKGAYAKINQETAKALPPEIERVNREEDMGLASLRKAKLSYYPAEISEEFFACEAQTEESDVWELWRKAFPADTDDFLATFIYPYSNASTRRTLYKDGKLAAMLHLFECQSGWGKVGYIYGLSTDERFRGQGLATRLIESSLREAYKKGFTAVWTIAANKLFRGWERLHFGEEQPEPLTFSTEDGFYFGENPETDRGIFRIVSVKAYLGLYAAANPGVQKSVQILDPDIPENSGTYQIERGTARKISDSATDGILPSGLQKLCPIPGGTLLSVAYGQH